MNVFTMAPYAVGYRGAGLGKPLPNLLLLVNKEISAEASDYLWNQTIHQICMTRFAPRYCLSSSDSLCAYVREFQKQFSHLSDPRIRRWRIRLLFPFSRINFETLLMDATIYMLSRNAATIRAVEFTVPCLCAEVFSYGFGDSESLQTEPSPLNTVEDWTVKFPPLLDMLAQLQFRHGTVSFSFARRELYPPCPLRRCKALASRLEYLKTAMQGGKHGCLFTQPTTACGLRKYRCRYWHQQNDSTDGDVVECGCGEYNWKEGRRRL
ncbi:MAG: hypothetical protein LQ345_005682 [Seirophora villosa]|nr:MAG: hypothetical protein LQ345_005682 [Seirophora villosa]